ncbi:MAG TPA: hypothetical protein VME17_15420 [Bryobacteraceae bacterium]|nr:hypothetical protein [Bryobacteraceae bacterium]
MRKLARIIEHLKAQAFGCQLENDPNEPFPVEALRREIYEKAQPPIAYLFTHIYL